MLESRKKLADEKVEEIKKSYDKAEQEYYKTKDEMPKGWDIVGMQVKPRFVRQLNSCFRLSISSLHISDFQIFISGC